MERHRLRADAQRQHARLRRQRARTSSGGHRVGVQKQSWNNTLYLAGSLLGYYAPLGTDPVRRHHRLEDADRHRRAVRRQPRGGGDGHRAHRQPLGATTSTTAIAPAPALLANGWNDDLFPVDESLRYYNKVRAKYPNAPISMFHLDFGHSPRAGAISAADRAALTAAENAWLDYYVKGVGSEPADARGGVDILTSKCPVSSAGTRYHAPSWAQLAPGEIRLDGAAAQTIVAPGTAPSNAFTSRRRLHDDRRAPTTRRPRPTASRRRRRAYTLAGSPTIVAKLDVTGANDMVAARLYDVDGATQRLIARGVQRPLGVGAGPTQQVFQLHPQAWTVQPGHVLKLELLAQDSPYLRTPGRRAAAVDHRRRPAAAAAGRRRARPRPRQRRHASPRRRRSSCPPGDKLARDYATEATGGAGGTVAATLSLTLGAPATLRRVHAGRRPRVHGTTTANVITTAGDAALTVSATPAT